ncbi:MAG: nucleoside triphosphate pyrophosphohydrolase [Gammaproteobacteria bacterium]|nr:nucleoside triphosphate pyrophosphohydrolase [Gammaproteobacteria bacterium]MCI0591404.1 nucleoside triphosphate pyrophosphohydrolase [Gammaproteobacteria bacterium]
MESIRRLLDIMARLRDPDRGCPWDCQQSFATIVPYTLEEAYEVADAVERGEMVDLRNELGDLLFQVVFHSQMAQESGYFEFYDVVEGIMDKLITRHPHVFRDAPIQDADRHAAAWEAHKERERQAGAAQNGGASTLDGVGKAFPALTRAKKLQQRAARVGFDWSDVKPVLAKIEEELDELRHEFRFGTDPDRVMGEMGDLLFACVNLARHAKVDPETALRRANTKFEHRFRFIERALEERGKRIQGASLEEMDALWEEAKQLGTDSAASYNGEGGA